MRKFSVIIPVYNVAPYLEQCLNSLLAQTYGHFEVLLIEDGSTDNSQEVADRFVGNDKRFQLIKQKNQGPSVARNVGIEQARGEYLVFLDGDDFVQPDYLEALNQAISDEDIVVIDGFQKFYEEKKEIKKVAGGFCALQESLHTKDLAVILGNSAEWVFSTCLGVYKRSFLMENQIRFIPEYFHAEDADFVMNALTKTEKGLVIPGGYYFYRIREKSLSRQYSLKACLGNAAVCEKWFLIFEEKNDPRYEALKRRFSQFGNSLLLMAAKLNYKGRKQLWARMNEHPNLLRASKDWRCEMALLIYQWMGYPIGVKLVHVIFRMVDFLHLTKRWNR